MANWANPVLTSTYTNFVTEVKDRDIDTAIWFEGSSSTGIPTNAKRYDAISHTFQKWNGTTWVAIDTTFTFPALTVSGAASVSGTLGVTGALTISGGIANNPTLTAGTANGVTYLNGSKVLTSGSALTFDGGNLNIGATGYPYRLTAVRSNDGVVGYFRRDSGTINPALMISAKETGNTVGFDTDYAGATSPTITFSMGGSEQMRLTSTGLGIGTSSPAEKLTVAGNIKLGISGTSFIYGPSTTGRSIYSNSDSTAYITAYGSAYGSGLSSAFQFVTGTTNVTTLDSSGNLGLGVTPSAWSTLPAIQISTYGGLSAGGGYTRLSSNAFLSTYPNTWSYLNTNTATLYEQASGTHVWKTAPSGTAGAAISFTQAMTLSAEGNRALGTSTVTNYGAGWTVDTINGSSNGAYSLYQKSGNSQGQIGVEGSEFRMQAIGSSTVATFFTNGAERARIDSSGNLLVGRTTSSVGNVNRGTIEVYGSSEAIIGLGSATSSAYLFAKSSEFRIVNSSNTPIIFWANNTERASIAAAGQMSTTDGAGNVKAAYDARAWVNFNGTGTVAIRASGNVTSITDGGTGDYTVNFTTALSDANYCWAGSGSGDGNTTNGVLVSHGPTSSYSIVKSTTQLRVVVQNDSGSVKDSSQTSVVVFR